MRFIACALEPVMSMPVVPLMPGVELGRFTPRPRAHFGLRDDRVVFLFMFDMASVMERKNPHALLDAFARAFHRDEPVQLVLKTFRGDLHPILIRDLRRAAEGIGALVIDEVLSREDSYALMHACDCYVSLHRSEGFGLTMAEAMLMGKPVIATGYSGNLDFMDERNSLLVDCKVVALERDVPPYKRGFRWGEPSVEHAARHLRWVYEQKVEFALHVRRRRIGIQSSIGPSIARIDTANFEVTVPPMLLDVSAGLEHDHVLLDVHLLHYTQHGEDGEERQAHTRWERGTAERQVQREHYRHAVGHVARRQRRAGAEAHPPDRCVDTECEREAAQDEDRDVRARSTTRCQGTVDGPSEHDEMDAQEQAPEEKAPLNQILRLEEAHV